MPAIRRAALLLALISCKPHGAVDAVVPTTQQARADVPVWIAGNDSFALELLARLAPVEGNLFFAPANLRTALAMTHAGAAGTTAQEMARALHFEALPGARLGAAQAAAADRLAADAGPDIILRAANRLWGAQDEPFLAAYLELTRTQYDAELVGVDFAASEQARQTINAWVAAQTDGKISELLDRPAIDASTRLVLTSAIVFKGAWRQAFDPARTQDRPFQVPGLAVAPMVPTMHRQAGCKLASLPDAQVVELPYAGGALALTIVLPSAPDGLPALIAGLDADRLAGWLAALGDAQIDLALPRFTTRARFDLADTLAAMGMPTAFTGAADFSRLSSAGGLAISRVVHEAFIAVDEAGTEAAGATAVVMTRSAPGGALLHVDVDRPFLYFIRDASTGQILFVGRVLDPRG